MHSIFLSFCQVDLNEMLSERRNNFLGRNDGSADVIETQKVIFHAVACGKLIKRHPGAIALRFAVSVEVSFPVSEHFKVFHFLVLIDFYFSQV